MTGVDYGCAVQVMAAVSIGSDLTFVPTSGQTLWVLKHAYDASFTNILHNFAQWCFCRDPLPSWNRMWYALDLCGPTSEFLHHFQRSVRARIPSIQAPLTLDYFVSSRLCLAIIVGVPVATPKEFRNTAKFAFGGFINCA